MTTLQQLQAMRANTRAITHIYRFTPTVYPVLVEMERQLSAAIQEIQRIPEGVEPRQWNREGTDRQVAA